MNACVEILKLDVPDVNRENCSKLLSNYQKGNKISDNVLGLRLKSEEEVEKAKEKSKIEKERKKIEYLRGKEAELENKNILQLKMEEKGEKRKIEEKKKELPAVAVSRTAESGP